MDKSTLLGLLNGTVTASGGHVRVLGADLDELSGKRQRQLRARIGTVHQRLDLADALRVVHNVNAGHLGRWPAWKAALSLLVPQERTVARDALSRVGIAHTLDRRTSTLSGGEQQRVALARVLVQAPELVLADEPVASLDPARGAEVMALLHGVCVSDGVTLLASLHDVGLARRGFDRVLGLREGRLVLDRPPQLIEDAHLTDLYRLVEVAGHGR